MEAAESQGLKFVGWKIHLLRVSLLPHGRSMQVLLSVPARKLKLQGQLESSLCQHVQTTNTWKPETKTQLYKLSEISANKHPLSSRFSYIIIL